MIADVDQAACARLLCAAILGRDTDTLIEFRGIRPGTKAMRTWVGRDELDDRLPAILATADRTNVYIGACPRTREAGTADAIDHGWVLWADLDTTESGERLDAFAHQPQIIVATGNGMHAWWALRDPLAGGHLERACRRLAHHLGGDMRATDRARILRIAPTLNHKTSPALPVRFERFNVTPGYTARQLVGDLPDPDVVRPLPPRTPRQIDTTADALMTIPASEYIPALTGTPVGRDGKARCPFHEDRTPSLHAYDDPARGWMCFGCGAGGTIIDFGARLYGIEPRGHGYHDIRQRLAAQLLRAAA